MMGVLGSAKSGISKLVKAAVPPVQWQRSVPSLHGGEVFVQARQNHLVGLRTVVAGSETDVTVFLSLEDAKRLSEYVLESIRECGNKEVPEVSQ